MGRGYSTSIIPGNCNGEDISDYQGEWHGNYYTLLDGRKVREFTDTSGIFTYQFVENIPEPRVKPEEKNAFQKTADAFQEIGADIWNAWRQEQIEQPIHGMILVTISRSVRLI